VVKYSSVNDFGTVINPLIVKASLHGGGDSGHRTGADGNAVYDEDGQFLTGSFMDMRCARERLPRSCGRRTSVPATSNVLGVKGCGKRLRRLAHFGHERGRRCAVRIRHPHMGYAADALRVWRAIQDAKAGARG